jgi:DNA polymerase III domain protein
MQNLATQFGVQAVNAHRAKDDARVFMDFFKIAVSHFFEKKDMLDDFYKACYADISTAVLCFDL